jgi:hypothetical protein
MKRGKKKINFSNRFIFLLVTLGVLAILAGGVYAISSSGANSGHPASDIDFTNAIIHTMAASASTSQSIYDIGGNHLAGQTIYSYNKICVGNSIGDCSGTGGTVITSASVSSPSFLYSSDKSLKTNIQPLQNSLEKIQQLQGVSFNWKSTGKADDGLIAQDVEKVFPELVSTDSEGKKSVEYGNLIGVLIEAIKEQQKQIDDLKSKCN